MLDVEMASEEVEAARAELVQRGLIDQDASAERITKLGDALGLWTLVEGKRRRKVQA